MSVTNPPGTRRARELISAVSGVALGLVLEVALFIYIGLGSPDAGSGTIHRLVGFTVPPVLGVAAANLAASRLSNSRALGLRAALSLFAVNTSFIVWLYFTSR